MTVIVAKALFGKRRASNIAKGLALELPWIVGVRHIVMGNGRSVDSGWKDQNSGLFLFS